MTTELQQIRRGEPCRAERNDFEVVYTARPSLTQPDFTAECLAARQAGAEGIIAGLDNNSYIRLGNSCARQNYDPAIGMSDQLALPALAQSESLQGDIVGGRLAPWPADDKAGLVEMKEAFAKYAPGTEVSGPHATGWLYAKVLEAAGERLPDNPTAEDLLRGLYAIKDNDFGGLTYPVTFTEGSMNIVIVNGLFVGVIYGMFAIGLVVVYRGSRVVNFAHGEIGMVGAFTFADLVGQSHLPLLVAGVAAIAISASLGAATEIIVARPLRNEPRLAVMVGPSARSLIWRCPLRRARSHPPRGSSAAPARRTDDWPRCHRDRNPRRHAQDAAL